MQSVTNNFLPIIEDLARDASCLASLILAYQLAIEQDMDSSTGKGFTIVTDKSFELSKSCETLFKNYQEYATQFKEDE